MGKSVQEYYSFIVIAILVLVLVAGVTALAGWVRPGEPEQPRVVLKGAARVVLTANHSAPLPAGQVCTVAKSVKVGSRRYEIRLVCGQPPQPQATKPPAPTPASTQPYPLPPTSVPYP